MKLSFKHLVFSTMLLALASGCGGSKSKGGGNSVDPYSSYNYGTNLISGTEAQNAYVSYISAVENKTLAFPMQTFTLQVVNGQKTCTSIICFSFNTSGSTVEQITTATPYLPIVRSQYPGMAKVVNPDPTLYYISSIVAQGNYIQVTHTKISGGAQIIYAIDTSIHAAANPFYEENHVTGKIKQLVRNF